MPICRLLLALTMLLSAAAATPAYHPDSRIAGPDGGWDYAAVDPARHQLLVARTNSVTIVDLSTPGAARSIGTIERGHAAVPIRGTGVALVTSGNDGTVRLLDRKTGAETARIPVGQKPDAAIVDGSGHAFVANAKDGTVSEIDVRLAKPLRTIHLKPGLEFEAIGPGPTLFVNNEETNTIETVDIASGRVGAEIAMPGCAEPSGLGYDGRTGVLIAACGNGKAAIVDARTRRLRSLIAIGQGPDAVLIDEQRRVALIPCGRDGVMEVLALDGPGGVRKSASVRTEVGARTGAVDPVTGKVYLPTASFTPPASAGGRTSPVPGTFHILVLSPS